MGNQSSQNSIQTIQQLQKYEEVSKIEEGVVYRLKQNLNQNQEQCFIYFLLKQHNYHSESSFNEAYKKYKQQIVRAKSENSQSNTLSIKQIVKENVQHFCSNTYKIYTLYQFPELTLKDEITVRAKQSKHFEQCQLIAILQTCILSLEEIRAIISFNAKSIFISPDGVIKVLHNDLVDQNYRHLVTENVYYAPEKLSNFMHESNSEIALKKQIIFSVGMTILQACCLEQLYQFYDYNSQKLNQAKLENKISSIAALYSTDLIELLSNMLEINPNRRISMLQVQRALNRYDDVQNSNQNQEISNQQQDLQRKCQKFFQREQSLPRIKQSNQSTEQPSVPNLLSQQNSSRVSLNKNNNPNAYPNPNTNTSRQSPYTSKPNSYPNKYKQQVIYQANPLSSNATTSKHCDFSKNQTAHFSGRNTNNNENIFTDPKLLEMIRKDLDEISKSRTSRLMYNDEIKRSCMESSRTNQNYNFNDFHMKRLEQSSNFHNYDSFNKNNQEFTTLNNCPQVQSLAASVANQNTTNQIFKYQESEVKCQPSVQNLKSSIALSSKNFQAQSSNLNYDFISSNPPPFGNVSTARYPLKQVSTNQFTNKSFSEIEDQIKKDMMKKKQANLVYLQQIYEDGVKYEGMSKNGLKQGYGKLIYSDGAYYEGYFHNDKINGKGTLYYKKDHPAYDGEWVDQQFCGYGQLYNQQPQELQEDFPYHNFNFLQNYWVKYQGQFNQDNKHGNGKILLTTDQYIEGEFKDDMVNGWARFYKDNGDYIEGRWENNLLVELKNE